MPDKMRGCPCLSGFLFEKGLNKFDVLLNELILYNMKNSLTASEKYLGKRDVVLYEHQGIY